MVSPSTLAAAITISSALFLLSITLSAKICYSRYCKKRDKQREADIEKQVGKYLEDRDMGWRRRGGVVLQSGGWEGEGEGEGGEAGGGGEGERNPYQIDSGGRRVATPPGWESGEWKEGEDEEADGKGSGSLDSGSNVAVYSLSENGASTVAIYGSEGGESSRSGLTDSSSITVHDSTEPVSPSIPPRHPGRPRPFLSVDIDSVPERQAFSDNDASNVTVCGSAETLPPSIPPRHPGRPRPFIKVSSVSGRQTFSDSEVTDSSHVAVCGSAESVVASPTPLTRAYGLDGEELPPLQDGDEETDGFSDALDVVVHGSVESKDENDTSRAYGFGGEVLPALPDEKAEEEGEVDVGELGDLAHVVVNGFFESLLSPVRVRVSGLSDGTTHESVQSNDALVRDTEAVSDIEFTMPPFIARLKT
ncbi:hypothetical protein BDV96DRAFT_605227 [Lophiotrema nucula]|uniref:Uncharacterized protein n=1 Tax=Lophiotrema nucula TaxID=690887 RepID=A0A6A5YP68_9PLEO|nr:hypothetical protein BDV96DRAFT_605227 [Lophiotrema nucula]